MNDPEERPAATTVSVHADDVYEGKFVKSQLSIQLEQEGMIGGHRQPTHSEKGGKWRNNEGKW